MLGFITSSFSFRYIPPYRTNIHTCAQGSRFKDMELSGQRTASAEVLFASCVRALCTHRLIDEAARTTILRLHPGASGEIPRLATSNSLFSLMGCWAPPPSLPDTLDGMTYQERCVYSRSYRSRFNVPSLKNAGEVVVRGLDRKPEQESTWNLRRQQTRARQ